MTRVQWVIQTNIGPDDEKNRIIEAVKNTPNTRYVPIKIRPFTDELPDLHHSQEPTVVYGATGFINNVYKSGLWNPGVFFDEVNFNYVAWYMNYGPTLLNYEGVTIYSFEDFAHQDFDSSTLFFIRPVKDLKEFSGTVIEFGELQAWHKRLLGTELDPQTEIVVAPPQNIREEWRTFVVDGRVVTGSHYRTDGRLAVHPGLPVHVIAFVERLSKVWSPAPVFCMDVAEDEEGKLKVIEINCFNSSGLYASDALDIVSGINNYLLKK